MKIVHLSYARINDFQDPHLWLKKISFYVGILEAMAQHSSVTSVHCISYEGTVEKNNVVYHFVKQTKWQHYFPLRLHRYLKNLEPDVIVVHGLIFPWQVLQLRRTLGPLVKIVIQHHAERPFHDARKFIQMVVDSHISLYFFCAAEFGEEWLNDKQISDRSKIKEVMEASSPFFPMEKEKARRFTKVSDGKIFLWVGRLDANKDPSTLARAFSRFSHINPTAKLYMIFQSTELIAELQIIISETKSEAVINLVGKVEHDDLKYWYNSADFIVSTSHYEGSGIAVCEGLSCGCIPILTNIPSFRMMTNRGLIGALFEAGNEDSLIAAFVKASRLEQDLQRKMVLEIFNNKLSFEAISKKIISDLNSIK
jgi:glycosyltransferase involved in cell wall biosynthesis